jgi:hypothetical protein
LQTTGAISVERKGKMWNYILLGLSMSSNLETQIKDSKLVLMTTNSTSDINWKFDADYAKAFRPSGRLPKDVLKQAGTALFENRTLQKDLPVLSWKGRHWKLNGWNQKGSMIYSNWKE